MRKVSHIIAALSALLPVLAGCGKDTYADMGGMQEVRFSVMEPELSVVTRASEVTASTLNSNGFYVGATKGSAGSETSVWTSTSFSKSGNYFVGGKYWPSTNQNQHFYACSRPLTFAAAGTTVSASNAYDIVCSYLPDPAYKLPNTLQFKHIFARIGDVTVIAGGGYTLTNVHVQVTPKTGGTYNLRTGDGQTDGTGWSSLTTGSATELANTTAGTKSNNLYLVPGTYDVSLSWTATNGGYTADLSKTVKNVAITGGSVNALSVTLKGSAEDIKLSVSITGWDDLPVDMGLVEPPVPTPPSFGGYMISPGPLYYNGTTFVLKDNDWNHDSYQSLYGKVEGSYHFSWYNLGSYFDSSGSSFDGTTDIDNANSVSYGGYDDWVLPTRGAWMTIINANNSRPGSTVNGTANRHYALIKLTGITVFNKSTPFGILLFPDDLTITGRTLSGMDNGTQTTGVTVAELNEYLDQGCAFFVQNAQYFEEYSAWGNSLSGSYFSATRYDNERAYNLNFSSSSVYAETYTQKTSYLTVRLVRYIY